MKGMKKLLKNLGALLALFFVGIALDSGSPALHLRIRAEESLTLPVLESASQNPMQIAYESSETFLSPVYEAGKTFELLSLHWNQELPTSTTAYLEIRFREGENWSEWQALYADDHGEASQDGQWSYVMSNGAQAFQYRANLATLDSSVTPKLSDMEFDAIRSERPKLADQMTRLIFSGNDGVVSRKSWGANESLRLASNFGVDEGMSADDEKEALEDPEFEDQRLSKIVSKDEQGRALYWPLQYAADVQKIVIHHTATSENLDNPEAAIRAIYQYHTVTRNWGDIGYNYIIAPDGRVFEGRYGGEGVVGAHAAPYNTGTIGISLLGNYQDQDLPAPMMESLLRLVYEKAELHEIDIDGESSLRGKNLPNLLAHQDVKATACPGSHVMNEFEEVQTLVAAAQDAHANGDTGKNGSYAFEDPTEREMISLNPGESKTITLTLKNTGTTTWTSSTGLTQNVSTSNDKVAKLVKNSDRLVATLKESRVLPGQSGTFNILVQGQYEGGLAYFDLIPVFDGSKKASHGIPVGVFVEKPDLSFQVQSTTPNSIKRNLSTSVTLKLKNTGNMTWTSQGDSAVQLLQVGSSNLSSATLLGNLQESSVAPGEMGSFKFNLQTSASQSTQSLKYQLSMPKFDLTSSSTAQLSVKVGGAVPGHNTSTNTSTTSTTSKTAFVVQKTSSIDGDPGTMVTNWIELKNVSGKTLRTDQDPKLSFDFEEGDLKVSSVQVFGPIIANEKTTKVRFRLAYPETPGNYTLKFWPMEGNTRLGKEAVSVPVKVLSMPDFSAGKLENSIRIKLTPDEAIPSPVISSSQTFGVYDGETLIRSFKENTRIKVTPKNGQYEVTSGRSTWTVTGPVRFVSQKDASINVLSMTQTPSWNPDINDNQFRGVVEVRQIGNETVLINELNFEDYLAGVAEVPDSEPVEKKKAMAVIIRSYALYYLTQAEKFPGMPYHLDDSPEASQKYLGYGFEQRSTWKDILTLTDGLILTYKGKLIKPPYFSQTDGTSTKSAESVWGWKDTPWLKSVSDQYCKAKSFAGHGVGLSGCGAKGMAEAGFTYQEILNHYYPGTAVSTYDFSN